MNKVELIFVSLLARETILKAIVLSFFCFF